MILYYRGLCSTKYELLNSEVPAESLAKFVTEQIDPAFDWKDAEWLCSEWDGPVAIKVKRVRRSCHRWF